MERTQTIRIKTGLQDPKGILLPPGVREQLSVEIADGVATFQFKNPRNMKKFAGVIIALEKKRGAKDTIYIERMQKAVTKYPGKSKEEIRDLLLEQLKQLGANLK